MELDKPEWSARCKPRRVLALLAVLAAAMMAAAPANPGPTVGETDDSDTPVHIPDEALRRALEHELGKAAGDPITRREMADLHRLVAGGVRQLTGIEYAVYLKYLTLYGDDGGAISNLTPLADLFLRDLVLSDNDVADLSPLASMTSLEHLGLDRNKVADLSPLAGISSLAVLALDDNQIANLSPLRNMTSLKWLYLAGNAIEDVSPLAANDGLDDGDSVDLRRNPLGAASLQTHIPALRQRGVSVSFDGNLLAIVDPTLRNAVESALAMWGVDFITLRGLDASNRGIEDLTGLGGASGLAGLFLERNQITDISPLVGLNLSRLVLSHNSVEDLSPFKHRASTLLALDSNSLRGELPVQWRCGRDPRYLYLADNRVSDIGGLADPCNLYELDISGNAITSLAPLYYAYNLRYLHVHDNEVTDISPLNFRSLRELHMRNNAVRDISPLLDGEELLAVDVRRNPLTDDALGVLENLRGRGVTVLAGETVPYFPAAGGGREGFVRIVNRGDEDGHVFIEAVDDAGVRAGPVRLDVGARRAVHFNSGDLENGNATKGIDGVGAPTAGDWRLEVISALDVEVLSYIRTKDGFVTAMHDVAADGIAPFFNPGSNRNQRSILRMVNTEAEPAKWTTGGHDDAGNWRPMAGAMLVRPQHALTLTAEALENAHGLGDGHGKWRLFVRGFPWYAMSLLESPTGHLTNLSKAPDNATRLAEGGTMHRLPLFPAPGGSREGFVRLINRSESYGTVFIKAVGERGSRSALMWVHPSPRQAVHFNSTDLEAGNFDKGLLGSVGAGALQGDWRLEVTSELALTVLAYARTADGFLTSLHDLAPVAEDGSHRVVFLNPGSNKRQVSKLRLINDGDLAASVSITGIDDQGGASGIVSLTVPAGSAYTFTSAELETGLDDGLFLEGRLGDGEGKWRLRVQSDEPIAVMSLLETPSGHLTNVSTGTAD